MLSVIICINMGAKLRNGRVLVYVNRLCFVITLSSILNDLAPESFWACNITAIRYCADSNL